MADFFASRLATIRDYLTTQQFPTNQWRNLGSWDYWSEAALPPNSPYYLLAGGVIVVGVISLLFWQGHLKKLQTQAAVYEGVINQLTNLAIFILIITISYWFFRIQEINYLSSRLVVLAGLIVAIGHLAWIGFQLKRVLPHKRAQYLEQERFFRYLPKKKKRDGKD